MTEPTPINTTDRSLNGRQPDPMSNTDHAVYAARRRLEKANAASIRMVIAALGVVSVLAIAEHPSLAFMGAQLQAVAVMVGIFTGLQVWWLTTNSLDAEQILSSIPPTRRADNLGEVVDVSSLFAQPKENL